ncbi:YggS family pyridoxal phosphate-dependent enzyme [bacterium]|nr:YggS family pyridoxal phosphate-dependent enzyme [bacterium]
MSIANNIRAVKDRIEKAADRAFRDPADVRLVAVTKTVDVSRIVEAIEAGIDCIGENRVQEAATKFGEALPAVEKHLIGHLQTNKVKKALELFDFIQSIDSVRLAREVSVRSAAAGRTMDVLVEVNTSGEESKYGLEPAGTVEAIEEMADLDGIRIVGLMTIGAFLPNPEDVRPCFRALRAVRDKIEERVIPGVSMEHLSMGMTNDYEVAIEEGATIVRVGRAIFGER